MIPVTVLSLKRPPSIAALEPRWGCNYKHLVAWFFGWYWMKCTSKQNIKNTMWNSSSIHMCRYLQHAHSSNTAWTALFEIVARSEKDGFSGERVKQASPFSSVSDSKPSIQPYKPIIMHWCACVSEVYGSVCVCVCVRVWTATAAQGSMKRLLVMFSWILIRGFATSFSSYG